MVDLAEVVIFDVSIVDVTEGVICVVMVVVVIVVVVVVVVTSD